MWKNFFGIWFIHLFTFFMLLLFSQQVMSDSLRPHGLQHARLLCPSLSPGVCSNPCSLSCWCHSTILFSGTPFSSCPQSFPASRSFPMSWLFASGDQSIGALVSESFLPVNIQGWFPLGLTGSFAHLAVQGTLKAWSRTLKDGALGQTTQKEWGRRAVAGVLRMGEHMHAHGWSMPMCQGPP